MKAREMTVIMKSSYTTSLKPGKRLSVLAKNILITYRISLKSFQLELEVLAENIAHKQRKGGMLNSAWLVPYHTNKDFEKVSMNSSTREMKYGRKLM